MNAKKLAAAALVIGIGGLIVAVPAIAQERGHAHARQAATDDLLVPSRAASPCADICPETIDALRDLDPSTVDCCLTVRGYHVAGDGGGGRFWWDPDAADPDNGGTIIESNWTTQGRWRRLDEGPFSVRWFGARGDGETDDRDAIQTVVDVASDSGDGTVLFPPGRYLVRGTIELRSDLTLSGTGPLSKIVCADRDSHLLSGTDVSSVTVRGLSLSSTADTSAARTALFLGASDGEQCVDILVADCEIHGFRETGVHVSGSAANVTLRGSSISSFSGARSGPTAQVLLQTGVLFAASEHEHLTDLAVEDCDISECEQYGVRVSATQMPETVVAGYRVVNNRIHDIGKVAILGSAQGTYIAGNTIADVGSTGLDWGVYIGPDNDLMVVGNHITDCAGGIQVLGDPGRNEGVLIRGNVIDRSGIADGADSDRHFGIWVQGSVRCVIAENYLTGARLGGNMAESTITGNIIDLAGVLQVNALLPGIQLGEGAGLPATDVVVANNRVFNGSAEYPTGNVGVMITTGSDLTIAQNAIESVFRGIHAIAGVETPIAGVTIEGNRIQRVGGGGYVDLQDVSEVEVRDNRCDGTAGDPTNMIGIDVEGDATSNVWIHHNRIGSGPSRSFRVIGGTGIVVEDNLSDADVFSGFLSGSNNIARRNRRIDDDLVLVLPNGQARPSVLGGDFFRTANFVDTEIEQFEDGYLGQVVCILADLADEQEMGTHTTVLSNDNIKLQGGASWSMPPDSTLTLCLLKPEVWHEIGRKEP